MCLPATEQTIASKNWIVAICQAIINPGLSLNNEYIMIYRDY